eukprot:GEMP01028224.1.p1 GENE.GEMP01028224.1~~GEMP01028224.1.p1  ORF type:complete len:457 (+),score=133.35 GEMP01028224.1:460-1830(+)
MQRRRKDMSVGGAMSVREEPPRRRNAVQVHRSISSYVLQRVTSGLQRLEESGKPIRRQEFAEVLAKNCLDWLPRERMDDMFYTVANEEEILDLSAWQRFLQNPRPRKPAEKAPSTSATLPSPEPRAENELKKHPSLDSGSPLSPPCTLEQSSVQGLGSEPEGDTVAYRRQDARCDDTMQDVLFLSYEVTEGAVGERARGDMENASSYQQGTALAKDTVGRTAVEKVEGDKKEGLAGKNDEPRKDDVSEMKEDEKKEGDTTVESTNGGKVAQQNGRLEKNGKVEDSRGVKEVEERKRVEEQSKPAEPHEVEESEKSVTRKKPEEPHEVEESEKSVTLKKPEEPQKVKESEDAGEPKIGEEPTKVGEQKEGGNPKKAEALMKKQESVKVDDPKKDEEPMTVEESKKAVNLKKAEEQKEGEKPEKAEEPTKKQVSTKVYDPWKEGEAMTVEESKKGETT